MRFKLTLIFAATLFLIGQLSMAQEKNISGTVTDDDGVPLPGVNVTVKGTSKGTSTDFDGNFEIKVEQGQILKFSSVGFQDHTLKVEQQETIEVQMEKSTNLLDQVVITGFGQKEQKKVSSASTEFTTAKDITKIKASDISQALQGQISGVNITSQSGQPGADMEVNIRGVGTTGVTDPLYVVDGVVIENGINYLDASNIERIDVLKDAASSSIYGARGANGVILITTKSGQKEKMNIQVNSYIGWQDNPHNISLLDKDNYVKIMNEARKNDGLGPLFTKEEAEKLPNQDWQKTLFQSGQIKQNHNLRLVGGGREVTYSGGISYFGQEGIVGNQFDQSNFGRITADLHTTFNVIDEHLKIGENLTYSHIKKRGVNDDASQASSLRPFFNAPPTFKAIDEDGNFARSKIGGNISNPLAQLFYTNNNENINDRIVGNIFAEAQFLDGFVFRTDASIDEKSISNRSYIPEYHLSNLNFNNVSQVTQGSAKSLSWGWKNTLDYSKSINGIHNIDFLLGMEARRSKEETMTGIGKNLIFDGFNKAYLSNATIAEDSRVNGNRINYSILSYFGRLKYDFDKKYLFTATLRRDASSEFGRNNSSAYFPAFSLGWNIDKENFFPDESFIDNLKIRASWGQNGNDQFEQRFAYIRTLNFIDKNYHFGTGDDELPLKLGGAPDKMANPDLKWETSEQFDLGIDLDIFKTFSLSIDFYNKKTRDWIVQATLPSYTGVQSPFINGGDVRNRGVEFSGSYNTQFNSENWNLSLSGNVAYNSNKVTKINTEEGIIHGQTKDYLFPGSHEINRVKEGEPIGYFYGLETNGVFQNQEEIDNYSKNGKPIQPDAQPGDFKYVDKNGDGRINDDDKGKMGDPNPDFTFGFSINLEYKAFDFSLYTYGKAGLQNIYGVRNYGYPYMNYDSSFLDRWHGEGTSNSMARVTWYTSDNQNYTESNDSYVEDADFLRIQTLEIGVDLVQLIPPLSFFNKFRIYGAVNNLYTFTNYKGLDPEVGTGSEVKSWASGVDFGMYPPARTFMVGIELNF